MRAGFVVGTSLALALAGCAVTTPSPTPTQGGVALQTLPSGPIRTCAGTGTTGQFSGDPSLAAVWIQAARGTAAFARIPTIWPNGFTARFTPDLEIVSDRGEVVAAGNRTYEIGVCEVIAGAYVITDLDGRSLIAP